MNLYTVASGIQVHNQWMGVIGNNVSNSGSVGYQKYSFEIADYVYQTTPAGSVGLGAGAWDIRRDVQNGALMTSTSSTHLAISGEGYFKVTDNNNNVFYTRAGVFNFNSNGLYSDPRGNAVMGFPINNGVTSASEQTITTPVSTIPAEATANISSQFNIGFTKEESPTTLFESWNNGINKNQYAQEIVFSVYTPTGKKQNVSLYLDAVKHDGQEKIYEYAIGIPAEDDMRNLPEDTKQKGLLMTGSMIFSSGGTLQNMSALVPSATPQDLSSWTNAPLNASGFPMVSLPLATGNQNVALDFGISSKNKAYHNTASTNPLFASVLGEPVVQEYASTAYSGNTLTTFLNIDGSAQGYLQNVFVDQFGVLSAKYSNGRTTPLYQLNLYTFQATDALDDKGNGLYAYNPTVGGEIYSNKPGEGKSGVVQGGYLEQSNVDIAAELVNMILCQNSLSANTKMFSTMDTMLQTAIKLKS